MTPRELRDYWIITPDDAWPRHRDKGLLALREHRATWPVLVLALATAAFAAWITR